jgi:hypothetical protein
MNIVRKLLQRLMTRTPGSAPTDYDRLPASRQFYPGARRPVNKQNWRRCVKCDRATPVWPDVVVEDGQLRQLGTYSYVCGHCGDCHAGAPTTEESLRRQVACFECGTNLEGKEQCPKCGFPRGWMQVKCPNCQYEHPVYMPHWVDRCDTFILECVKCEQSYVSLCIC